MLRFDCFCSLHKALKGKVLNVLIVMIVFEILNRGVINLCPHSDTIGGKTTIKYCVDALKL